MTPPRQAAIPSHRARYELPPFGVHWPEVDEDLSVEGMLEAMTAPWAKGK